MILLQKLLLTFLLFLVPVLFPSRFTTRPSLEKRFTTWDTTSYLEIARDGYTSEKPANQAFYPLWPLFIRSGAALTGASHPLVGYVLSNFFSLAGILLFHRFVWLRHGLPVAYRATVLMLLFPGSIYFFFPYTESLFLFLTMTLLLGLQRTDYPIVAVTAFLLPMTRAVGAFVLPFLMWELFRRKAALRTYAVAAAPLAGYACYFGTMYFCTGNAFAGFDAQERFPAQPSVARIFDLVGFAQSFVNVHLSHNALHSFFDRALFVAFLLSLYWVIRLDSGYYVYSIFNGMVPAFSNVLMSFTRFLSLVFPFFIFLGQLPLPKKLFWILAAGFGAAQTYCFFRHICGRWVG